MTDDEFDLLDELYFLQSFAYLQDSLGWEDERLLLNLEALVKKGWIKCFSSPEEELFDNPTIKNKGRELYYLATKKGLLQHNTR